MLETDLKVSTFIFYNHLYIHTSKKQYDVSKIAYCIIENIFIHFYNHLFIHTSKKQYNVSQIAYWVSKSIYIHFYNHLFVHTSKKQYDVSKIAYCIIASIYSYFTIICLYTLVRNCIMLELDCLLHHWNISTFIFYNHLSIPTIVFQELKWPPFFANYSVMVILIEK